jgi:hypothetical protein
MEDRMARSSLDEFIAGVRASLLRGLPVEAEDVLAGLEYALSEKRDNQPVRFDLGNSEVDRRARLRRIGRPSLREQAEARQQADLFEENRRFGQPHFGHGQNDAG